MAAHRYWRLVIWRVQSNSQNAKVNEIIFATTPGGTQAAVGGVATASSQFNTTYTPDKAFNGIQSSADYWQSANEYMGIAGSTPYQGQGWLQYDMGAGNAIDVVEMRIYIHTANTVIGPPRDFSLFYSDNGVNFTHLFSAGGQAWSDGETKTFDVTTFNSSPRRVMHTLQNRYNAGAVSEPNRWRNLRSFSNNTIFSGPNYIAGSTVNMGEPFSRRVDLLEQKSGLLARSVYSGDDGTFIFENIGPGPWSVVGVDETASQNSVIYAHVNSVPMP